MNNKKNTFSRAVKIAFGGLLTFFKTERNGKIQLIIAAVVLFFSYLFSITKTEWMIVLMLCVMVLCTEMLNTAIEKLCDRITTGYDEEIKRIKDISAGAVLLVSLLAVIIGLIIFAPYLMNVFSA